MLHQVPDHRCIRLALALGAAFAAPALATGGETQVIERLLELPTHADSLADWPEPPPPLEMEPGGAGSDFAVLAQVGWKHLEEEPSPETRQRLLEAALEHPDWIPQVLEWLPKEPEAFDRVKLVYHSAPAQRWYSESWGEKVSEWLMLNSEHLREELVGAASQARDNESGYVENATELEALARLDWEAAAPILSRLAGGRDLRTKALALSLQYRHFFDSGNSSQAGDLRAVLQAITLDESAPGSAAHSASIPSVSRMWMRPGIASLRPTRSTL